MKANEAETEFGEFGRLVRDAAERVGIPVDESQVARAWLYYMELRRWSRAVRLIAEEDPGAFVRFHLVESFWVAENFLAGCRIAADIGSGAGLPGLAAALLKPEVKWYLLESNLKKATFLEEAARKLSVEVEVVAARAERWAGWPAVDRAFVRGIKLTKSLLQTVEAHGVSLACLCGAACPLPEERWHIRRREAYPLARARFCVLAEPARLHVPRGT